LSFIYEYMYHGIREMWFNNFLPMFEALASFLISNW
jgi:hypothetical protein